MRLPGLFVTGTDTGVGKTRVAAAIAVSLVRRGLRVGVLKPAATGASRHGEAWQSDDADLLIASIGGGVPIERVAPLLFEDPLAPDVAARRAGRPLEFATVRQAVADALDWWSGRAEVMVVEGVGGILTPLAEGATVADLAAALDYPVLIVARRSLGTLNHTLMTVECALRRGLRVAGVVLNSPEPGPQGLAEATNAEALARRLDGIGILAELIYQDEMGAFAIAADAPDWYDRMRPPRIADPGGPSAERAGEELEDS